MRTTKQMLQFIFFMVLSLVMMNAHAQTGLNFQGVARTTNNVILASQAITIKLSILQGSSTGTADYTETRKVTTNAQGLFTAVIGDTGAISSLGNFSTINWKNMPKFLKIEMDASAGTNFITMGDTVLLPYNKQYNNCAGTFCYTYSKGTFIYKPHTDIGMVGRTAAGYLGQRRRL